MRSRDRSPTERGQLPAPGELIMSPELSGSGSTCAVRRLVEQGIARLRARGVPQPRLDVEVMLSEAGGVDRCWLYAHPEGELSEAQRDRFQAMLERRTRREPLAYILGRREFYGLDFSVTPDVMIPRPETEGLVDQALDWLRDRPRTLPGPRLADIGAGSGAIAVAAATVQLREGLEGRWIATDVSAAALNVARANARLHGVTDRIEFRLGPFLLPIRERLDALCANPPYVPESDRRTLEPEVIDWEPEGALFSGDDGLTHLRTLILEAPERLRPGGLLLLEIGFGQAQAVEGLIGASGQFEAIATLKDLAGHPRWVRALRRDAPPATAPDAARAVTSAVAS